MFLVIICRIFRFDDENWTIKMSVIILYYYYSLVMYILLNSLYSCIGTSKCRMSNSGSYIIYIYWYILIYADDANKVNDGHYKSFNFYFGFHLIWMCPSPQCTIFNKHIWYLFIYYYFILFFYGLWKTYFNSRKLNIRL